jgi:fluoride ion exporter CrcB/FEX
MMERGETASAAGYALGSVLAGLLAVWLGVSIARRMVS